MANKSEPAGPHGQQPSKLYTLVMTPINFVTFLVSLLLIELRYTIRRSHLHSEGSSRLPAWLHHLLYHPQPYQYTSKGNHPPPTGSWFYHSKQKKLMRMEADEAFAMRNTVLVLFAVLAAAVAGGTWALVSWGYSRLPGLAE